METARRESGIELIKIIAILLIVISHVTQTLGSVNASFPPDYVIDLTLATRSARRFILTVLRYFGQQGNYIFFVCSAWFLPDSRAAKGGKIAGMIADTWLVSMIALAAFLLCGISLPPTKIVKCVFPVIFANNWYVTCYLLFYAIHPALNLVIRSLDRRRFLAAVCVSGFLYFGICFLISGLLFNSSLVTFVVIYFFVAFLKIHAPDFCGNRRLNWILLLSGIILNTLLLLLTNLLGLHIDFFKNRLLVWCDQNPFLLMTAVGAMNLARGRKFSSGAVNYVSGLSLLIYIIHENILVREYLRPLVFIWIQARFGYSRILGWVFLYSAVLFAAALLLAVIYRETLGRFARSVLSRLCGRTRGGLRIF